MKIFTTAQIAELDNFTIENEPISAIDLMERASVEFATHICNHFKTSRRVAVFAGPGNNGGDALAISRLLSLKIFTVEVFIADFGKMLSECAQINLDRLKKLPERLKICSLKNDEFPSLIDYDLIIDGLFGSGLSRPLDGYASTLVKHLNQSGIPIISIDIPSGLMGEDNSVNDPDSIIHACLTLTFQFPKLSFYLKDNEQYTGDWKILPIRLHQEGIDNTETLWHATDRITAKAILKPRRKFSHKGSFGHALLVTGSLGKMGATVLSAKGCLRSGVGLLTVHIPKSGNEILQTAVPEAMVSLDESKKSISKIPIATTYKSIGIGPGIGQLDGTAQALRKLLKVYDLPMVIDADALNILSSNREMFRMIPSGSILTPHPVEFERLTRKAKNEFDRINLAKEFAMQHHVVLVLKGANTLIAIPDGKCWFNSTGNPGMATGGSGDVLTGILTGLLAQGYPPSDAAILGVYLHGLAADLALEHQSEESLLAGDITEYLGKAFSVLKNETSFA